MRGTDEIGAAVVGTGFIGVVHVEALRRIGVQVRGVVGSSAERGRQRAAEIGAPAFASLEEALADDGVDVVHVTSPNHLHHPQVTAVLAAGKHVVCEKPLALTSAETADLLGLAEASGLIHAVNFNIRFYPICQHVRGLVADGALGTVRMVTGAYLQDWLLEEDDWNWRLQPEQGGALRAVGDIGSHWLDLTQHVTGLELEAVMAELTTFLPVRHAPTGPVETFSRSRAAETREEPVATEDTASILLRFRGGARGSVTISQISAGRKNAIGFQVDGAESAAAWNGERPGELWIGHRGRPSELFLSDPAANLGAPVARLPAGHAEGFADTFAAMYRGRLRRRRRRPARRRPGLRDVRRRAPRGRDRRRHRGERPRGALDPDRRAGGSAMKLGLLTAAFDGQSLGEVAAWASRQRLRGPRDRLLARRRRRAPPLLRRLPHRRGGPGRAWRGGGPHAPRVPRPRALGSRLLPEQPRPGPRRPVGRERAPAPRHRCGGAPRRLDGGHVHRPRPAPLGRGEPRRRRRRLAGRCSSTPASAASGSRSRTAR